MLEAEFLIQFDEMLAADEKLSADQLAQRNLMEICIDWIYDPKHDLSTPPQRKEFATYFCDISREYFMYHAMEPEVKDDFKICESQQINRYLHAMELFFSNLCEKIPPEERIEMKSIQAAHYTVIAA